MRDSTWKRIETLFSEFPFMKAEPVSDDELKEAEQALGVTFVEDYREFVRRYGGALVGPYPVLGLRHADPMDDSLWSVVEVTKHYQQEVWKGIAECYVISVDHAGNPIVINSKGQVRKFDHDFGEILDVANSFEDYLLKCLM